MVRIYLLTMCLFLGCLLHAQETPPCTDFNQSMGNWMKGFPPEDNISILSAGTNQLDGSPCLTLKDEAGGTAFINQDDYKNLGTRFSGQCLFFDYYLENATDLPGPVHPSITLGVGSYRIVFIANITVTPGSGWVRVKAPLIHSVGGVLPSNADGTWVMSSGMTAADFDYVMDNNTFISITPELTSLQDEVVMFDNICVKSCNDCNTNFKLSVTFSPTNNAISALITMDYINPNSMYKVRWGDGTVSTNSFGPHIYNNLGSYKVEVFEIRDGKVLCVSRLTFCHSETTTGTTDPKDPKYTDPKVLEPGKNIFIEPKIIDEIKEPMLVPNPANDYFEVRTNLTKKESVTIKIIDMMGKVVSETTKIYDKGQQKIRFSTEKFLQGTYIVEINANNKINKEKLLISK